MHTVTWKSVIDGIFARPGMSVPTAAGALNAALEYVASRLRQAWEYYKWPELTVVEYRLFRDTWEAGVYAAGDEVYHNGSYWRATGAVTADDVPGEYGAKGVLVYAEGGAIIASADGDYLVYTNASATPSKWAELIRFRKVVLYAQTDQEEIGAVLGAWTLDPLKDTAAVKVDFSLMGDGAVFPPDYEPDGVWVGYRLRAPEVSPVVYSAEAVYVANDAVYVAPGAYLVLSTTTAGETPTTAAAKFRAIAMPAWLAPAVKAGAYADLLEADSRSEKAARIENQFIDLLEEQVWQLSKLQGQTTSLR